MKIFHTANELTDYLKKYKKVALVPTMGNLHQGHLNLIKIAKQLGDVVVTTIFVNRLQFGPNEDFDSYPRTFESDVKLLDANCCDVLFAPTEKELYPTLQNLKVMPPSDLADILEGEFRPGFFTGVATVVSKLFNIVRPSVAVFGQKDYQQLMVIQTLVKQLNYPIEIVKAPIFRADDGLALSSRNTYLSPVERGKASVFNQTLCSVVLKIKGGERDYAALENEAKATLKEQGWLVDYVAIRKCENLQPPSSDMTPVQKLVVLGAAKLGKTRLIDNVEVG